jgi:hypothetical protein
MTNTLHRRGSAEDLKKDFIIFCTIPKWAPKAGRGQRLKEYAHIVLGHKPVIFGSTSLGAQSWLLGEQTFIENLTDDCSGMSATFTDVETLCKVIADLWVSASMSAASWTKFRSAAANSALSGTAPSTRWGSWERRSACRTAKSWR